MKKVLAMVAMMVVMLSFVSAPVFANKDAETPEKKVTLTDEQKEEIAKLHREAYEKKKEVVSKYVEYGVFTEEKGKFILEKMEQHMKELEQNGYIPKWERHKHPHHK